MRQSSEVNKQIPNLLLLSVIENMGNGHRIRCHCDTPLPPGRVPGLWPPVAIARER